MILEDFDNSAILISDGKTYSGLDGVQAFSIELFIELPKDCGFELTECIVLEKNVYIVWNAESETAVYDYVTDTFGIEDGKITLQTAGFVKHEKA